MFIANSLSKPISGGKSIKQNPLATHVRAEMLSDGKLANPKGTDVAVTGVNCLSFDGTNDEVNFGQALDFATTDSWTTEFTIKFDSTPSAFTWIVGKESSSKGWAIRNGDSSNREKLCLFILGLDSGGGAATDVWQTTQNVLDDTLTTWKIIYNGSSASFYKNGSLQASSQITDGNVTNMSTTGSSSLGQRIGSTGDISADVSNLKVYNDTTTFLHCPLAEGSGTTVYDISGNSNHGTISGATWATLDGIPALNLLNGFSDNEVLTTFDSHNGAQSTLVDVDITNDFKWKRLQKTGSGSQYIYYRDSVGAASSAASQTSRVYFKRGNWDYLGFRNQDTTGGNMHTINTSTLAIENQGTGYISSSARDMGDGVIEWTITSTTDTSTTWCGVSLTDASGAENHSSVSTGAYVDIAETCFTTTEAKIPLLANSTQQVVTFDGSNAYINVANSGQGSDFDFKSNNFTIEVKADLTGTGVRRDLISRYNSHSDQRSWGLTVYPNYDIGIILSGDGTNYVTAFVDHSATPVPQKITNLKVVKEGTIVKFYFDDVLQTTAYVNQASATVTAVPATLFSSTANTLIGGRINNSTLNDPWDRDLYSVKVTDNTKDEVILDYDFQTSSDIGTTKISSKNNSYVTFDGTDDYIDVANSGQDSDFDFKSDNFTIEGKADLTNDESHVRWLIAKWAGAGARSWGVYVDSDGEFVITFSSDGTATSYAKVAVGDVPQIITNWKVVKDGTTVSFYFDDVQPTTLYTGESVPATIHSHTTSTRVGGVGSSFGWDKELYFIKVTNDTTSEVVLNYTFNKQSDFMTGNVTDLSGKSHNGTVEASPPTFWNNRYKVANNPEGTNHDGTITNATLATFWGKRAPVTDGIGYTVPANYETGGLVSRNLSGHAHNNFEGSLTLPIAGSKTYAQLAAVDNSSATQLFVRKGDNDLILDIVESTATATGATLEEIRRYVGH